MKPNYLDGIASVCANPALHWAKMSMLGIGVESVVKYSFVLKGMQTRRKGQYNADLTLLPHFYVKVLITAITAIEIDIASLG